MKIIRPVPKRSGKTKYKKGVSFWKTKQLYYRDVRKSKDKILVTCVNADLFDSYEELKRFCISLRLKELKICIIGDCRWPPMPFPVFRYYLVYNRNNFIGEEYMGMYGNNAYLTFYLDYPEDFDKVKNIMHRVVYLNGTIEILLICNGTAVLPYHKIVKEDVMDYNMVLLKDTDHFFPIRNKKSFDHWVMKKI